VEQLPPTARIELHFQKLLKSQISFDAIAEEVLETYSSQSLTREELECISIFLLYIGHYVSLSDFLMKMSVKGLQIPWAHFCETLFLSTPAIPESIKLAVIRGAEMQGQLSELSRSRMLDHFDERLQKVREERKETFEKQLADRKDNLIAQAEMLKTQGLVEEEGRLLESMKRMFPGDAEIQALIEKRTKRKAMGLLHDLKPRKESWIPIDVYLSKDKETEKILTQVETTMVDLLQGASDRELTSRDFAIAHLMWENYDAALAFLDAQSIEKSTQWLRYEILLRQRKFVDLLSELVKAESRWLNDPDATFGILYLRSLAMWEMGQKQAALEIMESISLIRPGYRNSISLLALWRESSP
jgi:hypothetical protein